ncbi:hypothetical protein Unana1_04706 [Umbelopsis nana]
MTFDQDNAHEKISSTWSLKESRNEEGLGATAADDDVFGNEEGKDIQYKTLTWPATAGLMIAETVSNGTTALPSVLGTIGLVPGVLLIVGLGIFALYTGILLGKFKLRHAQVHNMGDAGNVLFGRIGREIFTFGSITFALASTSGQLLSGQIALNVLDSSVCQLVWLVVFAVATFLCALPRTLEKMSWLSALSFASIVVASLVGMIGGGINKDPARVVQATISGVSFYNAFLSVTNIIFAYAGHFAFFAFISEMKNPKDCVKAIWALQGFSVVFYTVFAVVFYTSFGNAVASPSFSSLSPTLAKVTYGLALPNFLIAGVIYTHVAAKILFIRFFRNTRHVHSNTAVGRSTWVGFCFIIVALAWILAEGVPNFSDLLGIVASLFASWYTYGISGMFWLYDAYRNGGYDNLLKRPLGSVTSILTITIGGFVCVAGTYVSVTLIAEAYSSGSLPVPFSC